MNRRLRKESARPVGNETAGFESPRMIATSDARPVPPVCPSYRVQLSNSRDGHPQPSQDGRQGDQGQARDRGVIFRLDPLEEDDPPLLQLVTPRTVEGPVGREV